MTQNLHTLFVRLALRVGAMATPSNRLFHAPDVQGARHIAVACGVFVVAGVALGALGNSLYAVVWAMAAAALFLMARNVPRAQWRHYLTVTVLTAAGVSLLLWLLLALSGVFALMLLPAALLGGYSALYRGGQHLDAPLRELGRQLGEGWSAFAPAHPLAFHNSRVIKGPGKRLFYLSVVPGRSVQHYDDNYLEWDPEVARRFDTVLAAEPRRDFKRVLWVLQPPDAPGEYEMELSGGVTTYIGDAERLAKNLQNWETMMANLHATQLDSREFGREVEAQAIADLGRVLPPDWKVESGIVLAQGGDADLLLESPRGRRYVVDIKSRTDLPDLGEDDPHRPKHWRDVHEQLMNASRQLLAEPVVWQPRARRGANGIFGEVRFVQGSASALLHFLAQVHGEDVRGARPLRGRNHIVQDHRPLGELRYGERPLTPGHREPAAAGHREPASARPRRGAEPNRRN